LIGVAEGDDEATTDIFFPQYSHPLSGNVTFITVGSRGILFYTNRYNVLTVEL